MSVKIKKKHTALAAMILALGAAVFINWYYTKPQAKTTVDNVTTTASEKADNLGDAQYVAATATKESDEEFAEFELERQNAHDKAAEALNDIIKDSSSSETAVSQATASLEKLSNTIKRESDLETLISAKTGSDCVVIIDGSNVKAVVEKGTLNDTVTMQIKELILNGGEFLPENITIFELKG